MTFKNKTKLHKLFLIPVFLLIPVLFALNFSFSKAQVASSQLNISAFVVDGEKGNFSNGEYEIRFSIYTTDRTEADPFPSDADGGKRVWQETQKISLRDGVLNAYLGAETPLPAALNFSSGEYYLGIRISNDSEMIPRKKIGAVPIAINSSFLNGSKVGTTEGDIVQLGKGGKVDLKILPTGKGNSQLVVGNDSRLHEQNTDLGTNSNSFILGQGNGISGNNFSLFVSGSSTNPAVRFNGAAGKWQLSNNGSAFADILTLSPSLSGAGTGISPFSMGDMLYFGTDGFAPLGIGNQGEVLTVENGVPTWMPIIPNPKHNLLSDTHLDSETADAVRGDLITAQGISTKWSRLAIGSSGLVLRSDGTDILWAALSKSDVGLGNVENTALSTWTGSTNITTLGTITAGTWHGNMISTDYLTSNVMIEGERIGLLFNDSGYITASTTDTLTNKTWNGNAIGYAYGGLNSNVSLGNGLVKISGGVTSFVADNSNNWNTAYAHSTSTGNAHGLTKADLGLGSVENTALSTWSGSTNLTTLGTISTGTWNALAISTTFGGTGLTTYAAGDMLFYSSGTSFAKLAVGLNGQVLTVASGIPTWTSTAPASPHDLLSVQHADSTAATALRGDLITAQGISPTWSRLALGANNTVLKSNGVDVVWSTLGKSEIGLGNVEDIALSTWAGSTNLTTLGTIATGTWNGTAIDALHGGTGISSYTAGDMLYYSSGSNLTKLAVGLNGQVLIISSGVPTWTSSAPASPHNFLSVQHSDVTPATAQRGDIITAQGVSPTWSRLSIGTNGTVLKSDGVDSVWSTLAKSDVGLSNVENTALSTWTGSTSISILGTVTVGTWNGSLINSSYLASNVMVEGENISLFNNNSGYITASTIDTLTNKTWNGSVIGYAYGGLNSDVSLGSGLVKISGGSTSFVTDNSSNWDSAYFHTTIVSGNPHGTTKSEVGLGSVENTALSTWAGSTNITTLGTITTGTWNGNAIGVAYGGTGTTTQFTQGSLLFAGASGVYSEDNANLFWDDTNNRLGIGTASPNKILTLSSGVLNKTVGLDDNGINFSRTLDGLYVASIVSDAVLSTPNAIAIAYNAKSGHIFKSDGNTIATIGTGSGVVDGNGGILSVPTINHLLNLVGVANNPLTIQSDDAAGGGNGIVFNRTNRTASGNNAISVWQYGGTELGRFTTSGNVGIGTANPGQKLAVAGNIQMTTGGYLYGDTTNQSLQLNSSSGSKLSYDANSYVSVGGNVIIFGNNPGEAMRILDGNVGIGTTSPGYLLDVNGVIASRNYFRALAGGNAGYAMEDRQGGGNPTWTMFADAGKFNVMSGANYRMTIDANGNLGIKVPSPTAALHVKGEGIIQGTLYSSPTLIPMQAFQKAPTLMIVGSDNQENAPGSLAILGVSVGSATGSGSVRGPEIYLQSTRATTAQLAASTFVASASGDNTGTIYFGGDTGGASNQLRNFGAYILSRTAADWSATSTPGFLAFGTTPVGVAASGLGSTTSTERMRIDSNGNVGIGLNNPSYTLDVSSAGVYSSRIANTTSNTTLFASFNASGTNPVFGHSPLIDLRNTNSTANSLSDIRFSSALTAQGVQIGAQFTASNVADFFVVTQSGAGAYQQSMTVKGSGNVGIGATNPGKKLEVAGDALFGTNKWLTIEDTGGGNGRLISSSALALDVVGNFFIRNSAGTTQRVIVDSNGNFGVGTTSQFNVNSSGTITAATGISSSGTINFSGLTASQLVATDASKNLISLSTLGVNLGGTGTTTQFTQGSLLFAGASGVYSEDNANLFWDDTNNRLGIGTATPRTNLDINGDIALGQSYATFIQKKNVHSDSFILQNAQYSSGVDTLKWVTTHASYGSRGIRFNYGTGIHFYADNVATTADTEFTPTDRMVITNSGNVGIGITSPSSRLDVVDTKTDTTGYAYSSYSTLNVQPSAASSAIFTSIRGNASPTTANNITGSVIGILGDVLNNNTGTLSSAVGIYGQSRNFGTGTVTNAFGVRGVVQNDNAAGTISNSYALFASNAVKSAGTITNNYGLYIQDQTSGATNYSIFSAGGANYFADGVSAGNNTAAVGHFLSSSGAIGTGLATINAYSDFDTTAGNAADMFMMSGDQVLTGQANTYRVGVSGRVSVAAANTNNITGNLWGITGWVFHHGIGTVSKARGAVLTAENDSTGTITEAIGANNQIRNLGAGAISLGIASNGIISNLDGGIISDATSFAASINNSSTGTITIARGVDVQVLNGNASGTIGSIYGIALGGPNSLWSNSGTINTSYGIYLGSSIDVGSTRYAIYSASTSNSYLAGNVGIGTAAPASKLAISGTSGTDAFVQVTTAAAGLAITDGLIMGMSADTEGFIMNRESGALRFGSANAEVMRISNGRIGIKTTDPGYELNVAGAIVRNTTASGTTGAPSEQLAFGSQYSNATPYMAGMYAINSFGSTLDQWLGFKTTVGGVTDYRMYISKTGNIGIGTTSPAYDLDVYTPINGDSYVGLQLQSGNYGYVIEGGIKQGFGGNLKFSVNNNGVITEKVRMDNNGNVGIGTTTPQNTLDLGTGTAGRGIAWSGVAGAGNYNNIFSSFSGAGLVLATGLRGTIAVSDAYESSFASSIARAAIRMSPVGTAAGAIQFFTDTASAVPIGTQIVPTERMRIDSSGNVGIGTNNPGSKLEVNGNVLVNGGRPIILNGTTGNIATQGQTASWANGFTFNSSDGTNLGGLYAYGGTSTLNYFNIGPAYSTSWLTINNGSVGIGDVTPASLFTVGSGDLFQVNSSGQIAAVAGYTQGSGNFAISGAGTFGTGTGAISLNGDTTIAGGKNFIIASGIGTFAQTYTGTATAATITANSLTNGNILSLTSTSTAAAAGNTGLNIAISGANGTAAITRYGLKSSVTATNATSGTNIAGYFSASGATTANFGIDVAAGNVRIGNGWLCVDNNASCSNASPLAGTVYAVGAYTTGADYAEYFYTKDSDLKSGEAVCVDPDNDNAIKRCLNDGDNDIMGIVSSNPSIVGNKNHGDDPNYKIIGMIGQVAGLVSAENGPIKTGDSLTASIKPGYMRRANAGESTVGIAMQNLASGKGTIQILISRRNKSLTVEKVEQAVAENIANMNIQDKVNQFVDDAKATLASQITSQGAVLAAMQLQLDDSVVLSKKLELQMTDLEARINPELTNAKLDLNAQDIAYLKLLLGVGKVSNPGDVEILGKLKAQILEGNKLVISIEDGSARTIGSTKILKVEVDADNDGIDDKTGSDGKKIKIKTTAVSVNSRIFVTPKTATDQPLAVIDVKDAEGFSVSVKNSVNEDVPFDWFIVEEK